MEIKVFYCNKCERAIKEEDLNGNEKEEIKMNLLNENVPSFICSECINNEMKSFCCWDEEENKAFEMETISPNQKQCLGCYTKTTN